MQKWEYCLMFYAIDGIYVLHPNGEKVRYTLDKHSWAGTMQWLGNQGWEAVNYVSRIGEFGKTGLGLTGGLAWPIMHEILLKRPIEE